MKELTKQQFETMMRDVDFGDMGYFLETPAESSNIREALENDYKYWFEDDDGFYLFTEEEKLNLLG